MNEWMNEWMAGSWERHWALEPHWPGSEGWLCHFLWDRGLLNFTSLYYFNKGIKAPARQLHNHPCLLIAASRGGELTLSEH